MTIDNKPNNKDSYDYMPLLLVLSLVTCCIEVDISVPSLPAISDYFGISDGLAQMTIAVNFLGYCLSSVFYGPLSDSYGRRKIMVIGNFVMLIGAAGCVVANSVEILLLSRFIQGLGASTSAVVVFAIISDLYTGEKAISLIGMMNALLTILMAFAPIVGGFINETVGWRGNYSIIAFISLVSWCVLFIKLPETKTTFDKDYGASEVVANYFRLLSNPSFFFSALVPSFCYAAYIIFIACCPFLYMETYKLSMFEYCMHQGAIILIFAVTSVFVSALTRAIGNSYTVILGCVIMGFGGIFILVLGLYYAFYPYGTTLAMMIISVGAAISYPIVFTKSLEIFPQIKGTASSAVMSMRFCVCSIFLAITGYFYDGYLLSVSVIIFTSVFFTVIFTTKLLTIESL